MDELKEIKPSFPDDSVLPQSQFSGRQLYKAPQAKISAPSGFTLSSGGGGSIGNGDNDYITKLAQRVLDLENVLINLGLLNHR